MFNSLLFHCYEEATMSLTFLFTFFRIIFWLVCVIFTINRVKTCFDIYAKDDSYSNTEYRDFLSSHSPYPAITTCISELYIQQEMSKFNISNSEYENPQMKQFSNLTYLYSVPYDKITLDPAHKAMHLKIIVYLKNKTALFYKFKAVADPNLRDKYFKCFTFDLLSVPGKINKVQVKMRLIGWHKKSVEVATYLHLPGLFRGARRYAVINEHVMNADHLVIVDDVEIAHLRSTGKNPCDPSIGEYDFLLVQDILTDVGCRPYYLMEEEYRHHQQCREVQQITQLNSKLDIKNTASTFQQFR